MAMGRTWGLRSHGGVGVSDAGQTENGWSVSVAMVGVRSALLPKPLDIDALFIVNVSADGVVSVTGSHDGFPSYDVWVYPEQGEPYRAYGHTEGSFFSLGGKKDKVVQ
jgi:hypothetical protein